MLKKHQIKKIIKQMVPSSVYSNPQRKMLRETAKTELYDYITNIQMQPMQIYNNNFVTTK